MKLFSIRNSVAEPYEKYIPLAKAPDVRDFHEGNLNFILL